VREPTTFTFVAVSYIGGEHIIGAGTQGYDLWVHAAVILTREWRDKVSISSNWGPMPEPLWQYVDMPDGAAGLNDGTYDQGICGKVIPVPVIC
jgi:hypothetical protein